MTPAGRLRLDAIARYLQEAAEDDVIDSGLREPAAWLLRRCTMRIDAYPHQGEEVKVRTFCSGTGPRWAERTTTLASASGDLIQARAIWVAMSPAGRPTELGAKFRSIYAASAEGGSVSARLSLPAPSQSLPRRPWPLRASDFDIAGHVNNAIHWSALEDVLAGTDWLPGTAELEYRAPILPGSEPALAARHAPRHADVWLTDGTRLLAAGRLASDEARC